MDVTKVQARLSRRLKRYRAIQASLRGRVQDFNHSDGSGKECAILPLPWLESRTVRIYFGTSVDRDQITPRKEKHHEHLENISLRSIALSMATNNVQASAVAAPQQAMPSTPQNATSPPSKRDLASWWKTFKKNARREEEKGEIANLLNRLPILQWSQIGSSRRVSECHQIWRKGTISQALDCTLTT